MLAESISPITHALRYVKKSIKPYVPFSLRYYYRTKLAPSTMRQSALDSRASDAMSVLNRYIELTTPTSDPECKRKILKDNLGLIEIEIASFCNRTCWFCPNSIIDRKSKSIQLPEEIFLKLIDNLAEIEYAGVLNFHRFNETLADRDLIIKRLKQTRSKLPNAVLGIFTNGDYLNREYLDELRDAGASYMYMSYYAKKGERFDVERYIKPAIKRMGKKLGLNYVVSVNTPEEYGVAFDYEGLNVYYRSWNADIGGGDRGGVIEQIKQRELRKRTSPCYFPLMDIYVDYNGLVMPCCNLRSDVGAHAPYILGDVSRENLFDLFMNDNFIALRQELTREGEKSGACASCHYKKSMGEWAFSKG